MLNPEELVEHVKKGEIGAKQLDRLKAMCAKAIEFHAWQGDPFIEIDPRQFLWLMSQRDWRADEVIKLRAAIKCAGFSVTQTSGDWSIRDVSEKGKAEDQRSLDIANENIELLDRISQLEEGRTRFVTLLRQCATTMREAGLEKMSHLADATAKVIEQIDALGKP